MFPAASDPPFAATADQGGPEQSLSELGRLSLDYLSDGCEFQGLAPSLHSYPSGLTNERAATRSGRVQLAH